MRTVRQAGALGAALFAASHLAAAGAHEIRAAPMSRPASVAEHQSQCAGKDGWSDPAPPVRIFANVFNVGTCGIVVLFIAGPQGHVVIDAATAEAAPMIAANIERLGYRLTDVKLLLSSHEHIDHAGGLAELGRRTGAKLFASPAARPVLESGVLAVSDPQAGSLPQFAGTRVGRTLRDGEIVKVGPLRLTSHFTPGHSPGSTSWSWKSCEGRTCHSIVYADSLSAVSSDRYRFVDHAAYLRTFRASIAKIARLPCDIVITPHPGVTDLYGKLAKTIPMTDSKACAGYAAASSARLDQRLAKEQISTGSITGS